MEAEDYKKRSQLIERSLRESKRNVLTVKDIVVPATPADVDRLEAHFDSAQMFWQKFLEAYADREELAIEAEMDDFPTDAWVAVYDPLHQEMITVDGKLRTLRRELQASQLRDEPPSAFNSATLNLTTGLSRPHLPEIPVPSFSGDVLKWTSFRDTFVSLIHEDPVLSNVQRFHYLISALKGEAASLVKNFPVDDSSYDQAWTKVKNTYNNPRVLASLLVQRILDCNTASCRNELQRYEQFLTGIADSVEAFRALRLEQPAEFLLSSLALRALDSATRRHFELSLVSTSDFPTVDKIIDFVRQRKLALKMSQDLGVKVSSSSPGSSSRRPTGVSFHLSDSPPRSTSRQYSSQKPSPQSHNDPHKQRLNPFAKSFHPTCTNCKGAHSISRCQRFQSSPLKDRIKLVKVRNLCFNCLSRGHNVSSCVSRFRCRECGKKHHSLIHGGLERDTAAFNDDKEVPIMQQDTFTGLGTDISLPSSDTVVLLRTVQLLVKGPQGKFHSARALLDTGSHRSFISASLAQKIGAKVQPYAARFTSLCGAPIPSPHFKGVTFCHVSPHSRENEFQISPIVVDKIISALPTQNLPRSIVQRLWNDSLADQQFHTPAPIDILIGQNLYDHVVTGLPYPTGVADLSYVPTIFGLVISGELQHEVSSQPMLSLFLDCQSPLQSQLKAFWELEEPAPVNRSHPDDVLPENLKLSWDSLTADWSLLSTISIPRYISDVGASHQLIGFCDASSNGYAAALHIRSESPTGEVKVSLIKAKSKVAPLKFHSIARLELCGALLLSRLVSSVTLPTSRETVCFTDSEVVLSWLRTPTYDLKVFEANRVSRILDVIPIDFWRHVSSEKNPADIAFRGSSPMQLKADPLWWSGPHWLQQSLDQWFQPNSHATVLAALSSPKATPTEEDWTLRFSSFTTLVRSVAYMLRFSNLLRSRINSAAVVTSGPITAAEALEAKLRCAAFIQKLYLPKTLHSGKTPLPNEFAKLQPFVDERGIIRVGGRLQESSLPDDAKHPILIPYEAHLAKLLVDHIHSSNLHAGATLCLSLLRSEYWIFRATRLIRGRILRCVRCRLLKAKARTPVMAPLPKGRFQQGKAFTQVGVDFAGPFLIKESRRRNAALGKAYLCLFVCFASKALHLELVSSLSTPAFLAALDRFVARRGAPSVIWSDHGSNFIGASRFIEQIRKQRRQDNDAIQHHLTPHGIEWKFIPPRAPHFGGLWEAGVKSVKSLLSSTVGKQPYTFEELLSKIEGLLNSRPLCALTEDVNDLDYLTPGHFLLGAPLTSLPTSTDSPRGPSSMVTRWNLLKEQMGHIWNRWSKEQQRAKWTRSTPSLKIGDLVILLERRLTIGQWPVARVVNVFPGRDGITRTVTVRTPSGSLLTRAVTSLAPLLLPEEN